jgi:small multidrug resistance pump
MTDGGIMHWIYLLLAICIEVTATSCLKLTNEFTAIVPTIAVLLGYGLSFYLLSLTLRVMPVGIAYALWCGIGIVAVAAVGWLYYGQKLDISALAGMGLILAGALIINLFSKSVRH